MARITVLIPTHNHGRLLLGAVRSVLRQTVQDFELFIIGDGVTAETREAAGQAVALDGRVRFFDHPKSPRTGEPYRHQALLGEATGGIVCYLSDDDLWLPDHLESICRSLETVEMAHAMPFCLNPDGVVTTALIDFSVPEWVKWTQDGGCRTGLSFVGHTMEFYRRLPHGWRTTPQGTPTDRHMWLQMLAMPGLRAAGAGEYTVVGIPSVLRKNWSMAQRLEEMDAWESRILQDPRKIVSEARRALALGNYLVDTGYHDLARQLQDSDAQARNLEERVLQWERRNAALPGLFRNLLRWYWKKKGL